MDDAPTPAEPLTGPHWDFALKVYGTPGVSGACLALQERHGLDVNVLLMSLWQARRGRTLPDIAELDALARPLREAAVLPLRAIRKRIKADPELLARLGAVRRRIAATEIEAEQVEQAALAAAMPEQPLPEPLTCEAAARLVVAYYAGQAGQSVVDPETSAAIRAIAAAAEVAQP